MIYFLQQFTNRLLAVDTLCLETISLRNPILFIIVSVDKHKHTCVYQHILEHGLSHRNLNSTPIQKRQVSNSL